MYNSEAMSSPDSEHVKSTTREIHSANLKMLMGLDIHTLVAVHFNPDQIGGDAMNINQDFNGELTARIKVIRQKTGKEYFYAESVEISFDGQTLSIAGAHPTYLGPMPPRGKKRKTIVENALKDAFENPQRRVITDFDPRGYY